MIRAFTNILCSDVEKTANFYAELLGMQRAGDFGWFSVLTHNDMPGFELGILKKDHENVPSDICKQSGGVILTFVVLNLEEMIEKAMEMDICILNGPTNMEYGQRRVLLCDPAGTVVDVSSPIV